MTTPDERARRVTVDEIRAALDAATKGKWEWKGTVAPDWMPNTYRAVDDLRVQIATPDKNTDYDLWFVLQAMKSGFVMVRNADAELIANAPDYLRLLLARIDALEDEREQLYAVLIAARAIVKSHNAGHEIPWNERETLKAVIAALDSQQP